MPGDIKRLGAIARTVTRPTITILFATALVAGVFEGIEFPQWFLGMALPVIGWWFVERSVRHIVERNGE